MFWHRDVSDSPSLVARPSREEQVFELFSAAPLPIFFSWSEVLEERMGGLSGFRIFHARRLGSRFGKAGGGLAWAIGNVRRVSLGISGSRRVWKCRDGEEARLCAVTTCISGQWRWR